MRQRLPVSEMMEFEDPGSASLLFVGAPEAYRFRSGGELLHGRNEIENALRRFARMPDSAHKIRRFLSRRRDVSRLKNSRLTRTLAVDIVSGRYVCAVIASDISRFSFRRGTLSTDPMGPVTVEMIRIAMKGAPLKSQQARVSLPTIQKYVNMLKNGSEPPPIRIENDIIVEGNHRYIAGRVFGKDPPIQIWLGGRPERVVPWEQVEIDHAEW